MNALLIMGYTNFELGIFKASDPKITVIKKAFRKRLESYLAEGLKWVIFTGALGFEYWALEETKTMQKDFDFEIATLFDFETHGKNWNEANQQKLEIFKSVNFVKAAYETYENPSQFRQYHAFLIENTQGALLFYDDENETKLHFLIDKMKQTPDYRLDFITFENLQETYEEMNE
ncbi:SLOG family protein [Lactococcus hircilactis]|uniref:SLOG family protein n=1 Tax=Lactococcus hircilactis TaxID=1494462 RepID=UPI003FA2BAAD